MSICAIENSFAKPPKFFTPKIPILCSQKTITKVVIQEYSRHLKQMRHRNQGNSGKSTDPHSRCNAPRPTFVCVFQTEREGESIEGVDAALCTVDRDSQARSKEMVYRTMNFLGYAAGIRDRRGD